MDEDDPDAGSFLKGPNLWPDALSDDIFRNPVMAYHERVMELHEILLGIMDEVLSGASTIGDEGRKNFEGLRRSPMANLKLLRYPPKAKGSNEEESIGSMCVPLYPPVEQLM